MKLDLLGRGACVAAALFVIGWSAPASAASFQNACVGYYSQGNDPDVAKDLATPFCQCLGGQLEQAGIGKDGLAFVARTLSEDLTTFIDEYPKGEQWMQATFAADQACKNIDYGTNQ